MQSNFGAAKITKSREQNKRNISFFAKTQSNFEFSAVMENHPYYRLLCCHNADIQRVCFWPNKINLLDGKTKKWFLVL